MALLLPYSYKGAIFLSVTQTCLYLLLFPFSQPTLGFDIIVCPSTRWKALATWVEMSTFENIRGHYTQLTSFWLVGYENNYIVLTRCLPLGKSLCYNSGLYLQKHVPSWYTESQRQVKAGNVDTDFIQDKVQTMFVSSRLSWCSATHGLALSLLFLSQDLWTGAADPDSEINWGCQHTEIRRYSPISWCLLLNICHQSVE